MAEREQILASLANVKQAWSDESILLKLDRREIDDLVEAILSLKPSFADGVEAAARVVEENQETTSNTREGTRHHLEPRWEGNLAGLAYATAIRSMLTGDKS